MPGQDLSVAKGRSGSNTKQPQVESHKKIRLSAPLGEMLYEILFNDIEEKLNICDFPLSYSLSVLTFNSSITALQPGASRPEGVHRVP